MLCADGSAVQVEAVEIVLDVDDTIVIWEYSFAGFLYYVGLTANFANWRKITCNGFSAADGTYTVENRGTAEGPCHFAFADLVPLTGNGIVEYFANRTDLTPVASFVATDAADPSDPSAMSLLGVNGLAGDYSFTAGCNYKINLQYDIGSTDGIRYATVLFRADSEDLECGIKDITYEYTSMNTAGAPEVYTGTAGTAEVTETSVCVIDCATTTCDDTSIQRILKITFAVSGVPDTLVRWRRVATPNILGVVFWEKTTVSGFAFANATYVSVKNGVCNFPQVGAAWSGSATVQLYDDSFPCPGATLLGTCTVTSVEIAVAANAAAVSADPNNGWSASVFIQSSVTYDYGIHSGNNASSPGLSIAAIVKCVPEDLEGTFTEYIDGFASICGPSTSGFYGTATPDDEL